MKVLFHVKNGIQLFFLPSSMNKEKQICITKQEKEHTWLNVGCIERDYEQDGYNSKNTSFIREDMC